MYHDRSTKEMQGFEIKDYNGNIVACACFDYKGYEISFSSIGYDNGGCLNEIVVFDRNDKQVSTHYTVQDAILFVDTLLG
jgi:hypothetical protein